MHSSAGRAVDANHIGDLIHGFYGSAAIFAAFELGVFSELARVRRSDAAGIAQALDLNPRSTTLLLDACVALGLLHKDGDDYFNSLAVENFLVPGRPLEPSIMVPEKRESYTAWLELPQFVRTGMTAIQPAETADPETLTAQLLRLHSQRLASGRHIVRRLDLERRRTLLEVGGGPGTYSVLIALEFPQIRCTVIDRPQIVRIASGLIEQLGASAQVATLAGDYRTMQFPPDNDVVLLFGVLHREPHPVELLRKAAQSLNPGGIVYVMETMTDESRTRPPRSALLALDFALTSREGNIFSHIELQSWMKEAGLGNFAAETLPPPASEWLAHARKPL